MASPDLTVLIPTRDRWSLLAAQTRAVLQEVSRLDVAFEIVVHDNSSSDATAQDLSRLPESVRYVRAPELFDTAEENICAALQHCRGRYIWLLADDDGIEPAGLAELVRLVKEDREDIIVFNSRHGRDERLPGDGPYVAERSRRLFFEPEMRCSIGEFVERTGFFYWLCAISSVVVRREIAREEVLRKYLGIARIYAHVAWLIEIGKDRNFLFVNRPLVVYGLLPTDHDGGEHWRRVALREGGYEKSVWTGLWLQALEELVRSGAMAMDDLRKVVDMTHQSRFHWASNLAYQVLDQLGEAERPVPSDDLRLLASWVVRMFPGALFLSMLIDEAAELSTATGASLRAIEGDPKWGQARRAQAMELRQRAAWWRRSMLRTTWWSRLYVETVRFYDVYDLGGDWVAAHMAFGSLAEALEIIDMPSSAPMFLRAESYEALRALIMAQPGDLQAYREIRSEVLALPGEWARHSPHLEGTRGELVVAIEDNARASAAALGAVEAAVRETAQSEQLDKIEEALRALSPIDGLEAMAQAIKELSPANAGAMARLEAVLARVEAALRQLSPANAAAMGGLESVLARVEAALRQLSPANATAMAGLESVLGRVEAALRQAIPPPDALPAPKARILEAALSNRNEEIARLRHMVDDARGRLDQLDREREAERQRQASAERALNEVLSSTSWRVSAPVRAVGGLVKRRPH